MFSLQISGAVTVASQLAKSMPGPPGLIPSHKIAVWLLRQIDTVLGWVGLGGNRRAEEWLYILVIAVLAIVVGFIVRYLLLWVLNKIVSLRKGRLAREMQQQHTLAQCAHIVTPLLFMGMVPFAFNHGSDMLEMIMRVAGVYALITLAIGICAVFTLIFVHYNATSNTRQLPIKGVLNVAKGITWIVILILSVAVLIDRSPAGILTGLGAFAAALMLIFRNTILGFTAGIQMAENDMIHVGDWIVVPGTPANGLVQDVSLSTVKVQNFDNTFVYVPPYSLLSGSFQNWRGMSQSGVRRIKQSFTISYDGIVPISGDLLDRVSAKYPEIRPYVDAIRKDVPADKWMIAGGLRGINGTMETNLGLFRAYLCAYLMANPHISNTHRVLVQLLDSSIYGIPLQVWCWANTTDWNAYESIQSAVMEHISVAAADFGLSVYYAGSEDITLMPENQGGAAPATAVAQASDTATVIAPAPDKPNMTASQGTARASGSAPLG